MVSKANVRVLALSLMTGLLNNTRGGQHLDGYEGAVSLLDERCQGPRMKLIWYENKHPRCAATHTPCSYHPATLLVQQQSARSRIRVA